MQEVRCNKRREWVPPRIKKCVSAPVPSTHFLYNRAKKRLECEDVFGGALLSMLYGTSLGRVVVEYALKKPGFTKMYRCVPAGNLSKSKIIRFVEKYNIDINEIEHPLGHYKSFNEFFTRKLKPGARVICKEPDTLISPADARLLVYQIKHDTVVPVKGVSYTIGELIRDNEMARRFNDGICMVFRLAPIDYHRFCYIDDGTHRKITTIQGFYHSVNPIAISSRCKVFQENHREYCVLNSRNFGDVLCIEVGAMLVGKIVQNNAEGTDFSRGQEKGYFEFGGSTIVLVFEQGKVVVDQDIVEFSKRGIECVVRMGSKVGKRQYPNQNSCADDSSAQETFTN